MMKQVLAILLALSSLNQPAVALQKTDSYVSKALTNKELTAVSQFQDSPEYESVDKLIDGESYSKFITFNKSSWVVLKSVQPVSLSYYEITSANDAPGRDPKKWLLEASNDGVTWQAVDQQSAQTFSTRFQTKRYHVATLSDENQKFSYFRFSFTHSHRSQYGDDYLQLAEIGLFVNTKAPIAGFSADRAVVGVNENVQFSDNSNNYPTRWFWTFEHGIPATSTEKNPVVRYTKPGSHSVSLTIKNADGEDVKFVSGAVKVLDSENPWQGFNYPRVVLAHEDTDSEGYKRLNRLIPDIEKTINDISLKVNKKLYKNFTQVPEFDQVTFSLQWSDVLASRGGSGKTMLLTFSTKYITEKLAKQPDEQVLYELEGVLWHELTHGYQGYPKNGEYRSNSGFHAFIEGVADLVRIDAGYHKTRKPKPSDTWLGGYTNTGFFLHWIKTEYETDFIYKFNQTAIELEPWSFETAIESVTGQPIDALWSKYQATLNQNKGK